MSNYFGARFFKCDLHMHSPMDASWREKSTKISLNDPEEKIREIARDYLRRCHEVGLEVIAITDHNYAVTPDKSFIRWLREENESVADEKGRPPLIIFPGFEVEADVGTGHHVICILPPDTPLNVVEGRVIDCGIKPDHDKRFDRRGNPLQSTKRLPDILEVIQGTDSYTGIVICPHPFNESGLLCDENVEMWLQEEEFKNPNLLCIEIPKGIEEMPLGLQKLIISGDDCLPEWKRTRPIAYVMSSDTKRIHASENDNANYIGFRSTWIKMSRPSIESLRQAFLDRESRIRFEECPDQKYTHSRLTSVAVNGATFYKAPSLCFSSNLNCIIGSRGTGKSTLVDYIRVALDQLGDQEIPKQIKEDIEKRIKDTLPKDSKIVIDFIRDGVPYRIEYLHDPIIPSRKITNLNSGETDPSWEIKSLFNIKILSQRQIDYSVDDKNPQLLRGLLDGFIKDQLNELKQRILEKKAEIKQLEIKLSALKEKQKTRAGIETQKSSLEATLSLLERLREPLERWQGICKEKNFWEALFSENETIINTITAMLSEVVAKTNLITLQMPKDTPNSWIIEKAGNLSKAAYKLLINSIENAVEAFRYRTIDDNSPLRKLYSEKWVPIFEDEETAFTAIKEELENKGDNPNLYLEYKKQLEEMTRKLQDLDKEAETIKAMEEERNKLLNELRTLWKEETKIRREKAEELMASLRIKEGGKPLVEISVFHQRDIKSILGRMSDLIKDKRRLRDEDINLLLQDCLEVYCEKNIEEGDQTFPEFLFEQMRLRERSEILKQSLERRIDVFLEIFTEPVIRELELERFPDLVEYKVYRQDGSLAGPIDRVSVGQRGLAFLNLLLASGNEPIIVDTPEEGLDNEGVYQELVPIFRREKEKRQIIVVTHNANIPVNADAELIVALEAVGSTDNELLKKWLNESGIEVNEDQLKHLNNLIGVQNWEIAVADYYEKLNNSSRQSESENKIKDLIKLIQDNRQVEGKIRRRQKSPEKPLEYCNGALDCQVVKTAVQDIMEGSEMAFTKRKEKYGF